MGWIPRDPLLPADPRDKASRGCRDGPTVWRRSNDDAARPQDATAVGQDRLRVMDVLEGLQNDHEIHASVEERQVPCVPPEEDRGRAQFPIRSHLSVKPDGSHRPNLALNPFEELSRAASYIQTASDFSRSYQPAKDLEACLMSEVAKREGRPSREKPRWLHWLRDKRSCVIAFSQ